MIRPVTWAQKCTRMKLGSHVVGNDDVPSAIHAAHSHDIVNDTIGLG